MFKHKRVAAITLAVLVLSLGAGCKKKVNKGAAGAEAEAIKSVPVPKELLGYVGLRSPGKSIDAGLALVAQFAALPFTREALLDMLAQQAQLPRGLMGAVDVEGTFWLLGLDEKQIGDGDPSVVVFPIKDKKKFTAALEERMKKGKADGDLVTYEPKEGQVGLQKIAMVIKDKVVLFPSSKKALAASRAYIEGALLKSTPSHDLEVHVLMEQVSKARGDALDEEIDRTVAEMKANMAKKSKGPIDQKPMADATEKTINRWVDYLKSTKEAVIALDVTKDKLTLSAQAQGLPGGVLAKVIKRQRTGAPVGIKRLPASSWLVISDHGNPESAAENVGTWGPALEEIFKDLDPKLKDRLTKLVSQLAALNTGDVTTALHRAPSGTGLTISALGPVKDAAKGKATMDELIETVGAWIKAEAKRQKEPLPEGLEATREEIDHKGAKGVVLSLAFPIPSDKAKEKAMAESLVGLPFTMGWAFSDKEMFVALGKESKAQLINLIEGKVAGKSLADKADFKGALEAAGEPVGLVYLSLVDLLRWFKGTSVEEMLPPPLRGDLKDPTASPVLTWGVDKGRTAMDMTLHLPAAHFLTFKPMLDMLLQSGGAMFGQGSKGL